MDDRPKACCVTGHRDIPEDKRALIRGCIIAELEFAIKDGFRVFISSFADGTDLLFADCVIEQKQTHPDLLLEAAIPYANRIKYGNTKFQRLLSQCDSVNILSEEYRGDCFFRRNRYMVQQSQRVIAVYDGREGGGTAFTMRYARTLGKEVHEISYRE